MQRCIDRCSESSNYSLPSVLPLLPSLPGVGEASRRPGWGYGVWDQGSRCPPHSLTSVCRKHPLCLVPSIGPTLTRRHNLAPRLTPTRSRHTLHRPRLASHTGLRHTLRRGPVVPGEWHVVPLP